MVYITANTNKLLKACSNDDIEQVKECLKYPLTQEELEEGFLYACTEGHNTILDELVDLIDLNKSILRFATNTCLNNKKDTFDYLMNHPNLSQENKKEIPSIILDKAISYYSKITFGKHIIQHYRVNMNDEFINYLKEDEDLKEIVNLLLHQRLTIELPHQTVCVNKAKI